MIIKNHKLFTEIFDCKSLDLLYSDKNKFDEESVLLIHGDVMDEEADSEATSWIADAAFITVFAAEDITRFSYRFLSQFDVRLSRTEYPATSVDVDDRYRFLCGDTAYELLCSKKTVNAPNFVTVFTEDDEFSKQAESYVSHICGDKSKKQLKILIGCLKAASKGGTDAVFTAESEGFYALMAQKTEDETDE